MSKANNSVNNSGSGSLTRHLITKAPAIFGAAASTTLLGFVIFSATSSGGASGGSEYSGVVGRSDNNHHDRSARRGSFQHNVKRDKDSGKKENFHRSDVSGKREDENSQNLPPKVNKDSSGVEGANNGDEAIGNTKLGRSHHSGPHPYVIPRPATAKVTQLDGPLTLFQEVPCIAIGTGHNVNGEELYPFYGDEKDLATSLFDRQSAEGFSFTAGTIAVSKGSGVDPTTGKPFRGDNTKVFDESLYANPEDADKNAKPNSIWDVLVKEYRNKPIAHLVNPKESAMCLISAVYSGNCKYLEESFFECIVRLGADRVYVAMSEKCKQSTFWKDTSAKAMQSEFVRQATDRNVPITHGKTMVSETCTPHERNVRYIPPSERFVAPFGAPRQCRNGALHYPIAFGAPAITVQDKLFPKLFDFHPVPLDTPPKPFSYDDEDSYQALATMSNFCMTHSRGGWDCGRHYEVMGAGCVPYFIDIHAAGPYILPQLPRQLLQDIVKKPIFEHIGYVPGADKDYYADLTVADSPYAIRSNFNARSRVRFVNESIYLRRGDVAPQDKDWYWPTAKKLLRFTQKYLTTEAMAAYVLKSMDVEHAKNVLVVTRHTWDNLHQSVVTGLDGLGINMTIVTTNDLTLNRCQQIPEDVSPDIDTSALATLRFVNSRAGVHGGGAPWANRMRSSHHRYVPSLNSVWDEIEFGRVKYDAVLFTYFVEDKFPLATMMMLKTFTNGKVAVMDHDDSMGDPRRNANYLAKEVYFFSRELRRAYC